MIRFIAAIDSKRGIANEQGIPWQGKLPGDVKYYLEQLATGTILMGYGVYREITKPYPGDVNYVATRDAAKSLRQGFAPVADARAFLEKAQGDIWNIGGAILFESTFDLADELYLTLIEADFQCTKFFPEYEQDFEMVSSQPPVSENDITYRFTVWRRKQGIAIA